MTISRLLRRILPDPRTGRGKIAIVAFLTTFGVLAGATTGYAYWQSSVSSSSTVGAANLTLSTTNFSSVGYTFGNDSLVTTGSITVTNSTVTMSTTTGAVSLTFGSNAAAILSGKVTLNVWSTLSAANCNAAAIVPVGATSALWSTNTVVTTTLAPSGSAIYCLRSSIAARELVASFGGTYTFTPKITGTITLGNFTGSATATTTTQSTQYIYPAVTPDSTHWQWIRPNFASASYNYCLDVSGASTNSGTIVISYGCKTAGASNQNWKFSASGNSGYVTIQPRNATALRVDNSGSTASGAALSVITAGNNTTATNQQWQVQQVSGGVYELVNALSGLCLTSPGGANQNLGQITQSVCSGSQSQQYLISQAFEAFSCSATSTAWTFAWTSAATGPYHVQVQGTTTDIAVTGSGAAAGISVSTTPYAKNTTTAVNFIDANGTIVGTGTLVRGSGNASDSCTANDLQ